MGRKIGIITLYEVDNYGNRLQNYAVVRLVKLRGIESVTISMSRRTGLKHLRDVMASYREAAKRAARGESQRTRRFRSFSHQYTPAIHLVNRPLESLSVDAFVIGSDQVWNPSLGIGAREDGMQFASSIDASRKIALSPSFGVSTIPMEWREKYGKWLGGFSRLSVREEAGREIIKNLSGKDAVLLIDPTMALSREEWLSIASDDFTPRSNYVFTYYLGDSQDNVKTAVEHHVQANYLELLDLMDPASLVHQAGPSDFISLIANSSYFVTDSFHGCVFAILFHKPFAVIRRQQKSQVEMFSRIDTLLNAFGLQDRLYSGGELPQGEIDWNAVDVKLGKLRVVFNEFLNSELKRTGVY